MTKLVNRAKMTTATTGTGTIALGSAVDGYQTFAAAGVINGDVVRYVIEDGYAWEIGLGTYTASGTTLTRGSIESSNADNPINLTGNAVVYVSAAAADLQELVDFADNFVLPTADGSTGQVLTTNGAGTLSFSTITGYTDADVDTHLNTSTATSGEVLSWNGSDYDWVAVSGGATDINGLADGYTDADGATIGLGLLSLANDANASGSGANIGIGYRTLNLTTTGVYNTAVGYDAMRRNQTNNFSTAVGFGALRSSRGDYNTGLGYQALQSNTTTYLTGSNNVGLGTEVGSSLSTGSNNFLGGYRAGYALTTGSNNIALGDGALDAATTGGRNIAIGQDAMGLGVATAANGDNVAIGYQAGYDLTSGERNQLIGPYAGWNLTSGVQNVSIGYESLRFATTAQGNSAVGYAALEFATGGFNTALGYSAGNTLTTGTNNTLLGNDAEPSSATVSNEITLGNSSITRFRVPGIQAGASDGDVLTYDATNGILSLQAAGGGGGLTLLSETTISSAVTSIDITFPAGYKVYKMIWRNVRLASDDQTINMNQLDSSGSVISGVFTHVNMTWGRDLTSTSSNTPATTRWQLTPSGIPADTSAQAFNGLNFDFTIWGVREATERMAGVLTGSYGGNDVQAQIQTGFSARNAVANSGVRISNSAGENFTSGSILLYGVA